MAKKIETKADLKNLALFYCSKRETSRLRLERYLERKCRENELSQPGWIEEILVDFENRKIVDDHRYSEIIVREYARRGKGKRYIEQKLKEKGIRGDLLKFETNSADEALRAQELALKHFEKLERRLGRFSALDPKEAYSFKQKILQKLIQSGFDVDTSRVALEKSLKAQK